MQIDHTYGGGTVDRKRRGLSGVTLYRRIIKYGPGGYQVLCANCNVIKKVEESEMEANLVEAPWTAEQVASLNGYQKCGYAHPFTGERGPGERGEETVLIATPEGWVEREGGPIVQRWAHSFMADGSWEKMISPWLKAAMKNAAAKP